MRKLMALPLPNVPRCRECPAGLACVTRAAAYYFRCTHCREYYVQIPAGMIKIPHVPQLGCSLPYASYQNDYASRCCDTCADRLYRGGSIVQGKGGRTCH